MFEFATLPQTKARDYAHIFAARAGVKDEDAAKVAGLIDIRIDNG